MLWGTPWPLHSFPTGHCVNPWGGIVFGSLVIAMVCSATLNILIATENGRQLRWDSFSSVFESKAKTVASYGLVLRRLSSD